jgi:hypothetical protein
MSSDIKESWVPKGGWNMAFSEQDKNKCTDLYIFFKMNYKENIAEVMAQMISFKQKYGVVYSTDQENKLREALKSLVREKH